MPNSNSTTLPETFPRALGSSFDPSSTEQSNAAPVPPPSGAQSRAAVTSLVTLIAKSLKATRPDWRNQRITRSAYASSRVSYVEEKMTEEQSREFE